MTATLNPTLVAQLKHAVSMTRSSRHHGKCVCCDYRVDGAGYCSREEWRANEMTNRILGQIVRLHNAKSVSEQVE